LLRPSSTPRLARVSSAPTSRRGRRSGPSPFSPRVVRARAGQRWLPVLDRGRGDVRPPLDQATSAPQRLRCDPRVHGPDPPAGRARPHRLLARGGGHSVAIVAQATPAPLDLLGPAAREPAVPPAPESAGWPRRRAPDGSARRRPSPCSPH